MTAERINRLMEAREYQKKAIKALLPDNMQGHAEVIEREIKEMIKEGVLSILQSEQGMEFVNGMMFAETGNNENEKEQKVKKVNIE